MLSSRLLFLSMRGGLILLLNALAVWTFAALFPIWCRFPGLGSHLALGGVKPQSAARADFTGCSNSSLVAMIVIDSKLRFQTMEGFGSTERVFDDPHLCNCWDPQRQRGAIIPPAAQQEIMRLIYDNLGLTRVRPATEADVEVINDNNDPEVTDLTKFNFEWKRNDAHIDYVKQAMAHGVTTHFLSPIVLESWMNESNPQEYVEWALSILKRWRDQSVEPPFYSIKNEPGYSRGGILSKEYLKTVIKLLGPKLRAAGLRTKFVITDDLNAAEAYERCSYILQDPDARQYVGALAYHLYGGSSTDKNDMKDLGQKYKLPIWMTEWYTPDDFQWAETIHELITNYQVSAIDYIWAFFGEWSETQYPGNTLIGLKFNGLQYQGYTPYKRYYYTGQYSRYVRPGYIRLQATSDNDNIKVTAFAKDNELAVVAINSGPVTLTTFSFAGELIPKSLTPIRTGPNENWQQLAPLPVSNGQFNMSLPEKSVTTFITDRALAVDESIQSPRDPFLGQNYPNPFNPQTEIAFIVKSSNWVALKIYNQQGQLVRTLVEAKRSPGEYSIPWNGRDDHGNLLPSGTYFYQLREGNWVATKRAILLK